jgi:aminopeptidase YwaD
VTEAAVDWRGRARDDRTLWPDFQALCDFGGRLAGGGADSAAVDWAVERLRDAVGPRGRASRMEIAFPGWTLNRASLVCLSRPDLRLRCMPLLRSFSTPPEGVTAPVIDLGVGRPADFERMADRIAGSIVLVEHEYPFTPDHVHRRRKYDAALAAGAVGFLIANPWPGGGLMSGSSGRAPDAPGIPAAYIDARTREHLREQIEASSPLACLTVIGEEQREATAGIAIADIPGGRPDCIVISAHIDGHPLAESALDNASGTVVAIAAARALAQRVGPDTASLRIALFNAEEWALAGSARYLESLPEAQRHQIRLNVNLDTVGGDSCLTALTSGFAALEPFLEGCAMRVGIDLGFWRPLMSNSDHANFARLGIPALRLLAGFNRPQSRVRAILSGDDRRELVTAEELADALALTAEIADQALAASPEQLAALAARP